MAVITHLRPFIHFKGTTAPLKEALESDRKIYSLSSFKGEADEMSTEYYNKKNILHLVLQVILTMVKQP